jgi:hypothetical protein
LAPKILRLDGSAQVCSRTISIISNICTCCSMETHSGDCSVILSIQFQYFQSVTINPFEFLSSHLLTFAIPLKESIRNGRPASVFFSAP